MFPEFGQAPLSLELDLGTYEGPSYHVAPFRGRGGWLMAARATIQSEHDLLSAKLIVACDEYGTPIQPHRTNTLAQCGWKNLSHCDDEPPEVLDDLLCEEEGALYARWQRSMNQDLAALSERVQREIDELEARIVAHERIVERQLAELRRRRWQATSTEDRLALTSIMTDIEAENDLAIGALAEQRAALRRQADAQEENLWQRTDVLIEVEPLFVVAWRASGARQFVRSQRSGSGGLNLSRHHLRGLDAFNAYRATIKKPWPQQDQLLMLSLAVQKAAEAAKPPKRGELARAPDSTQLPSTADRQGAEAVLQELKEALARSAEKRSKERAEAKTASDRETGLLSFPKGRRTEPSPQPAELAQPWVAEQRPLSAAGIRLAVESLANVDRRRLRLLEKLRTLTLKLETMERADQRFQAAAYKYWALRRAIEDNDERQAQSRNDLIQEGVELPAPSLPPALPDPPPSLAEQGASSAQTLSPAPSPTATSQKVLNLKALIAEHRPYTGDWFRLNEILKAAQAEAREQPPAKPPPPQQEASLPVSPPDDLSAARDALKQQLLDHERRGAQASDELAGVTSYRKKRDALIEEISRINMKIAARERQLPAAGGLSSSQSGEQSRNWTTIEVDTLKRLWMQGRTAGEIARIIGGISRNAVIGKAKRLGLPFRAQADLSPRLPGEDDLTGEA